MGSLTHFTLGTCYAYLPQAVSHVLGLEALADTMDGNSVDVTSVRRGCCMGEDH